MMTATLIQAVPNEVTDKLSYSPEEYLEIEEKSDLKHEYRDGEIVEMAGGTTNHNEIAGNCYTFLKLALKGKQYRIYFADVRLWMPQFRQFTYPDVMVIQGEPIYVGKGTTTITNPMLIVEVLSPSTQDYDRGTKFTRYRSIPELRDYILIDPDQFAIEQFTKNPEGQWVLTDIHGEDRSLVLASLDVQIRLKDIYEGVMFAVGAEQE
ncbi:Uma2 family endonuclease [Thermosynechococcaceae cyanobacterium BACA0444]|uniref:Uma2 family endonuclease n=1 Tax=Pseudocalidococcus azoricus BACA0444 TaxID=2918990 RepID=A0AAE4FQR6_9CYAN|nr:Uma2 family endonuclease [Pseudocalidococcus azoricus]MDS3859989.1 Uma2 family endonuclease [Pseudocalidococcus azoricus BACA0444]